MKMRTDDEVLASMEDKAKLRFVLNGVLCQRETKGVARAVAGLIVLGGFDSYEPKEEGETLRDNIKRNVRKHWPHVTDAELEEALGVMDHVHGYYRCGMVK